MSVSLPIGADEDGVLQYVTRDAMATRAIEKGGAVFHVALPMHESGRPLTLAELEAQYIAMVMKRNALHQGKAARELGISYKTLYRKLQEEPLKSQFQRPDARSKRINFQNDFENQSQGAT